GTKEAMPMRRASMWLAIAIAVVAGTIGTAAPRVAAAVTWERAAGIELEGAARLDGGAVISGSVLRAGEQHPALLVRRYDAAGGVVWSRTWHPNHTRVDGLDVAVATDGAVYVVGDVAKANLEGGGFFLRKYGPGGALKWTRISDGGYGAGVGTPEISTGVAVRGGRIVIVGHEYACCGQASYDGWIRSYRPDGALRWRRNFEVPGEPKRNSDLPLSVAIDGTGIYVAGHLEMAYRTDASVRVDTDLVVQKLGFDGGRRWSWLLTDSGVKDDDTARDVAVRGGRVWVTGDVDGKRGRGGAGWLGRFTPDGVNRWRTTWGKPSMWIRPHGLAISPTGEVLVAGTQRDIEDRSLVVFVRKLWRTGDLVAKDRLDDPRDVGAADVTTAAGGAYVAGWLELAGEAHEGRLWRWAI
ncbi:MAG TPA: hypothetical protein VF044_10310, partial [Actinomycetota bacterium]